MTFPKTYPPGHAPSALLALVNHLMPLLLEGDHPTLAALREQYRRSHIGQIELTGAGFYVNIEVSPDAPLVTPDDFEGGSAAINLAGMQLGAGCVLFVREGRLSFLEGYTYDEDWPEDVVVVSVSDVSPIEPPDPTTKRP